MIFNCVEWYLPNGKWYFAVAKLWLMRPTSQATLETEYSCRLWGIDRQYLAPNYLMRPTSQATLETENCCRLWGIDKQYLAPNHLMRLSGQALLETEYSCRMWGIDKQYLAPNHLMRPTSPATPVRARIWVVLGDFLRSAKFAWRAVLLRDAIHLAWWCGTYLLCRLVCLASLFWQCA